MSQIYLAGPFFSEEQIDRVSRIEKALEENKTVTSFYSPRHHQESNYELFSAGWAQEVYEKDMEELTNAEFVVAILDFRIRCGNYVEKTDDHCTRRDGTYKLDDYTKSPYVFKIRPSCT